MGEPISPKMERPFVHPEAAAKLAEESAKARAEQPPNHLHEAFLKQTGDISQHLNQAVNKMREIDNNFSRAFYYEAELVECKRKLQHTKEKYRRLQAQGPANEALVGEHRTQQPTDQPTSPDPSSQ